MGSEKIIEAIKSRKFEDLKKLHRKMLMKDCYQDMFELACKEGYFDAVKFIYCEYPQLNPKEGFSLAAEKNHMNLVIWLYAFANVYTCRDDVIVKLVQEHGVYNRHYREMILWLYANIECCTQKFDETFGPKYISNLRNK